MAIIKNALTYGFGFNIEAAGPIDSRMRVPYKSDLTTAWGPNAPAYAGMVVVVNEENKEYILKTVGFTEKGAPIAADPTLLESWVEMGADGAGPVSYEKFTVNEDGTIVEATGVGQVIYITLGDDTYGPGAYIVNKEGSVHVLSTATVGDEDLATIVSGLGTKVDTIDETVKNINSTIDAMDVESKATATSYVKGVSQANGKITAEYGTLPTYSLVKLDNVTDYAASYQLALDGVAMEDVTINIPKDMVVSSGEVVQDPEGEEPGLYIALTLANAEQSTIYIPVNKLVDDYASSIFINVDENGTISFQYKTFVDTVKVNGVNATVDEENNLADFKVTGADTELGADIMNGEEVVYASDAKLSEMLASLYQSMLPVMYYEGDDEEVEE